METTLHHSKSGDNGLVFEPLLENWTENLQISHKPKLSVVKVAPWGAPKSRLKKFG